MLRIGIQVITRRELERALRRGRRLHTITIGWTHLSRGVSPSLAAQALGRTICIGPRTGFRRVG